MGIIYILTVLLMIILHMLLYKKQQKQNIIKWLSVTIIMFLCYNILVCAILSFIKIPSTLLSLSIINIITNVGLAIKIYKDKKIQKYSIDIVDIILVLAILAIVIVMVMTQYGMPMRIKHIITDATVHYFAAEDFYNYSFLLYENHSDLLEKYNLSFLQPGAYINTGIVFKVFSAITGVASSVHFYQLYFLFDVSIWFLSGILMYSLLIKSNKKKKKIIPAILAIIYMIGYPLNSLISGFSYLTLGLNIVVAILIIIKEKLDKNYKYLLMFILDFALLFTYYFFAPVVYVALFLQIIINVKKKNEKLLSKDNILNVLYTLIIPAMFWFLYFIIFQIFEHGGEPAYGDIINIGGDIYSNFITNNLIFLVLSIYYIIYSFLRNKRNIKNNMLIIQILFMQVLFFGMALNKVSEYYYYKTYYLLWILVISIAMDGIRQLTSIGKKTKYTVFAGVSIYVICLIYSVVTNKNLFIFDIFKTNSMEIQSRDATIMTYEEVEVLDYYNKNINIDRTNSETYICSSRYGHARGGWIYAITKNGYNLIDYNFYEERADIQNFIKKDKKYFLILKNDYGAYYKDIEDIIKDKNIQILFKNSKGMILEKF